MTNPVKRVVILGGGTAGWITAGLIAADHPPGFDDSVQVTLIESPDVGPIGVGEGTWPTMRETLKRIGLPESDFIASCEASFKQGSKFIGWANGELGDQYYHPFMLPEGYHDFPVADVWQRLPTDKPFAEVMGAQPHVCERALAPKQITTPDYEGVFNYGYHLNAGLFGERLKQHCTNKLGVRFISDHVTGINGDKHSDIEGLHTREHGLLEGDLFIDCSGSKALLIGEHYGVPFRSQSHILFNDRALAVQVPYATDDADIASATLSTAQDVGWIWDIGLPSRRGVGYVFASGYTDEDQARVCLDQYLRASVDTATADSLEPRLISFEPGYRQVFWQHNCVAVGMASGFLEPLEASALALVELSAKMISDELPMTRATMGVVAKRFNERFHYRWNRIIEFLKLHYVLSQRPGAYWQDNRDADSIPQSLTELLSLWQQRTPNRNDFYHVDEVFPAASYWYVLYGMGFKPEVLFGSRGARDYAAARSTFEQVLKRLPQYLQAMPTNRRLIKQILAQAAPTP
ncbi:tryptophan halogenase family protein [Marinimicrobium sp. ABcell2]|uniref:tryptophan halogenase family protein n=1 Tax=Marinimicrobium sp. ABcell2 TaxID=3069751 RepID=UPI0027AFD40A|nr:tryptophan halogenase family protein [Marinimicrobium sp. ABcell2]MDQ2075883.1 tryptophan 7-halogenase [Marinimicrobium sp. ABcell2]